MIDKWLYNFFGSIDTFFEWLENLFKKNERHKTIRKTQSRNTAKEKK